MYRWHNDRARSARVQKRKLKFHGYWVEGVGRFRKNSWLGCPNGRNCGVCHSSPREKTRQERRADISLAEQEGESMQCLGS